MDTFYDFMDYLNKNGDRIKKGMKMDSQSKIYNFYRGLFNKNYFPFNPYEINKIDVAATDSSEFTRMLYSGRNIIIIRGYTAYNNEIVKDFKADIIPVNPNDLRNFTILLMENSEHRSIINLLDNYSPEYIFVDGSLKGRLSHRNKPVDIENYETFMDEYFKNLKTMIKKAYEKNVKLIFIAKSDYSDSFRKYLLSLADKGILNSDVIEHEKKYYSNDHYLIKSFAEYKGYTQPLMYKKNLYGTDINYVTFDVLPDLNDLPMKIDVLSREFLMEDLNNRDNMQYDIDKSIINLIFYGYNSYKVYNLWLVNVDRQVKFRSKEMENVYMKAFERATGIPFYETRGERRVRLRV